MKSLLTLINFAIIMNACAQTPTTIYCFPGQGADKHIFSALAIDSGFVLQVIEYGTPEKHQSMQGFARQLSTQIDTAHPFILMGVSLGGMICSELAEILQPEKTIIISSAKNRRELPFRYQFQRVIPLYKLFPGPMLLAGAKMLQPIVEPDRNKHKDTFKSMLAGKSALYMKRTIGLIINWNRMENTAKIYHIHGDADHTLPIRRIREVDYKIKDGSHMMTLTRAGDISEVLNQVLNHK